MNVVNAQRSEDARRAAAKAFWKGRGAGRESRGTSIPGTYNVGGRHVAKPTGKARDSSQGDR